MSPCERNRLCVRGFKHGGKGGMCAFGPAATGSQGARTGSGVDDHSRNVSGILEIEHRNPSDDMGAAGDTASEKKRVAVDGENEGYMYASTGGYQLPAAGQALVASVAKNSLSHLESPEQEVVDSGETAIDGDDVEDEPFGAGEASGDGIQDGEPLDDESCDALFVPPQQILREYIRNAGSAIKDRDDDAPEMRSRGNSPLSPS